MTSDLADAFQEFARQEHKRILRHKSKTAGTFANEKWAFNFFLISDESSNQLRLTDQLDILGECWLTALSALCSASPANVRPNILPQQQKATPQKEVPAAAQQQITPPSAKGTSQVNTFL